MMTLEQAINRLEDMVSGCYQQQFPNSELRQNTRASVDLIKFSFMSLIRLKNEEVRASAFDTIIKTVLDDTPLPDSWQRRNMKTYVDYCKTRISDHKLMKYPDLVEECIDCCEVILKRLGQDDPYQEDNEEIAGIRKTEHHKRLEGKYLYFRKDDTGSQYVWVKKIYQDEHDHFLVDGTVIYTNGINNTIGLYDVTAAHIEDFYNFGDKKNRFTNWEDLEKALHAPMDTRLKSHIISCKEAAEDILFIFTWFYEIHIPEMARILKRINLD